VSAADRRLDNLLPGLTARERAVIAIKAWKEDGREPLGLRRRVPPDQDQEFYDLLSYFRSLGLMLAFIAPMWRESIEKHTARKAWLLTLDLTEAYVSSLSNYILVHTRERITESQHARLIADERAKMLPLADLAEMLAEDDYVGDSAVARVTREKKGLLRTLFDAGTVAGRRKGKSIELNLGSFFDWLGEAVSICPEWGLEYEVVGDELQEEVRQENEAREHARSIVQRALRGSTARAIGKEPSADDLYAAVERQLIAGIIADSREIRAAEKLVAEFQERLGGEDPLDPEVRKTLDYCGAELAQMRERLGVDADDAIGNFEENFNALRRFVERNT